MIIKISCQLILEKLTSFCFVEIYLEYYHYIQKDQQILYRQINMLAIFQYDKICSPIDYGIKNIACYDMFYIKIKIIIKYQIKL